MLLTILIQCGYFSDDRAASSVVFILGESRQNVVNGIHLSLNRQGDGVYERRVREWCRTSEESPIPRFGCARSRTGREFAVDVTNQMAAC